MRKLLFATFAIFAVFAILGCSSDDKMPCATCENSSPTYCLYSDGGSIYCNPKNSNDCKNNNGVYYDSDPTCDNYLRKQTYCLSNDGDYDCEYVTIAICEKYGGYYYGNDLTCGGNLPSSSSTTPSSSSSVSSSSVCDANDYKPFVTIGSQVWMGKNLNCYSAYSKCYNNDIANCNKYGRLYTWAGAMSISKKYNDTTYGKGDFKRKGLCPDGWHIPSIEEVETLMDMIDGVQLKSKTGWNSDDYYNSNGTDDYNFTAMPSGYGYNDGDAYTYDEIGYTGYWWTATEEGDDSAYNWYMSYNSDYADEDYTEKDNLYSVRCLKN